MKYKKFIIRLSIFFLCLFILDRAVGKLLEKLYFTQSAGQVYRTNFAISETRADVIIMGSSRALHHYHPEYLKINNTYTFYNCGDVFRGIYFHIAILRGILERYKPKLILFDINAHEFLNFPNTYDLISPLIPYYRSHPEMREIILMHGAFERIKLLSWIYPYNSSLFTSLAGHSEWTKKNYIDIDGYNPLPTGDSMLFHNKIQENWNRLEGEYEMDTLVIHYFKKLAQTCFESNVPFRAITSPYYTDRQIIDPSFQFVDSVCKLTNGAYYNFSWIPGISDNPVNFADLTHLSEIGSVEFSKIIADSVLSKKTLVTPGTEP